MADLDERGHMVSKVMILYILDRIRAPISDIEAGNAILSLRLMDYFAYHHYVEDLRGVGLIDVSELDGRRLLRITERGSMTLGLFAEAIPLGYRVMMDVRAAGAAEALVTGAKVRAEYVPCQSGGFLARCSLSEGSFPMMEVTIATGSVKDARMICESWKGDTESAYLGILNSFMRNERLSALLGKVNEAGL